MPSFSSGSVVPRHGNPTVTITYHTRSPSDTTTKSESIVSLRRLPRQVSNTTLLNEAIDAFKITPVIVRTTSDTTTRSESISKLLKYIRSPSDTNTLSESLSRYLRLKRILSDTTTLSDSLARHLLLRRGISDSIIVVDGEFLSIKTLEDTIAVSESLTRIVKHIRIVSDTKTLSDSISRIRIVEKVAQDTTVLSESLIRTLRTIRSIIDSTTASELIDNVARQVRVAQDTTNLTESTIIHQILKRLIQDTLTLSEAIDTPAPVGFNRRNISETIILSELLIRYGATKVFVVDNITLSESLSHQRTLIRIIENFIGYLRYKRHITNTTTLSESIDTNLKLLKHLITDDITLNESLIATVIPSGIQFIRRPEDTIILSQILSRNVEHFRTAEDSFPEKFDAASQDQFLGVKRRKLTRTREEKPVLEAPPTRSLLGSHIRRRHRMRSI